MTMYYLYIFVFGGLIAKYRLALISKYHMVISRQKGLLLFAAVLIYNYANFIPLSLTKYNTQLADFLTVAASCYFILTAIAVTDSKTLFANRAMLFLGRISYSLYLVHLPVWIFFRNQFYGKMPVALLALLGLLVCFFAAVIFNRWVEGPTIKLIKSKRLKLALTDK